MREMEEFTQYRQRFKPFGELKESHIDDIIAAFERKGKFTAAYCEHLKNRRPKRSKS